MAETGLTAEHQLQGFSLSFGQTTLNVVAPKELLAIALPRSDRAAAEAILGPLPRPSGSTELSTGQHLLWAGPDQLLCFGSGDPLGEEALARQLGGGGYVTDVSDGWFALRLSGPDAQPRLDLITPPDLSDAIFAVGDVTSTVMSHLRVVIWRQRTSEYILLSASSSAHSFIHNLKEELSLHDAVTEIAQ